MRRLGLLEQILIDLAPAAQLVQPGWRCLEVGAGGRGSMAAWLAEQVGATGHVVATDVDTRYLSRLEFPNLEVIEHNILEDPNRRAPTSFVRSRLLAIDAVPSQGAPGTGDQADGRMPTPRWLAPRRGRGRGTATPRRSCRTRCTTTTRLSGETETWWVPRWIRQGIWSRSCPRCSKRCGLQDIPPNEASTEVVRGGSLWARWWIPTLEVINELGGGDKASRREVEEVMTTALARPNSPGSRGSYYTPVGAGEARLPVGRSRRRHAPAVPQGSTGQAHARCLLDQTLPRSIEGGNKAGAG